MQPSRASLPSDATAEARAAAIDRYGLLDDESVQAFGDLTKLASTMCQAPIALVTLLEGDRQYFKAMTGIELEPMPIEYSFCAHAMDTPEELLVIEDAREDTRFDGNPVVHGDAKLVSYAGSPLVTDEGVPLGTICVLDTVARTFTPEQQEALRILGRQVMDQIVLQRRVVELERSQYVLESLNRQLDQFAYIISHDLKAPIRHQTSFARIILEDFGDDLDGEVVMYLEQICKSGQHAQSIITDLNDYLHTVQTAFGERQPVLLRDVIEEVIELAEPPPHITVAAEVTEVEVLETNVTALRHILLNLIANALKFNHRDAGRVDVRVSIDGDDVVIKIADDGPGLTASDKTHVFQLFGRGSQGDSKEGRGLGLTIASKLAQNLGGNIAVESEEGAGATFVVRLPRR